MDPLTVLPEVHVYLAMACNHTVETVCNQSITCNYQYLAVNDRIALFHVIYFKHGCSNLKVLDDDSVQCRYNMKGEVERVYERLPCPMMGSAQQMQATSGLAVGVVIDRILRHNLILLSKGCTHALMAGRTTKQYLENVVHLTGVNVHFLFNSMIRVEKNIQVATRVFVKNIIECLKQFLFVKQTTKRVDKSGQSSAAVECPYGAHCKLKQYRQKFESYKNYATIHYAMCSSIGVEKAGPMNVAMFRFRELVNLIATTETRLVFDHVLDALDSVDR